MSFSTLRNQSSSLTEKLKAQLNKQMNNGKEVDERFWKLKQDATESGYALIRFLPAPPTVDGLGVEESNFVRTYDHGFKGRTGKWYIEKSRASIDEADPVGEYNSMLWNSGTEAGKKQASAQKRRTQFVSNILVIDDPMNPANNGKVFLFSYGKKIFEKINDRMFPKFQDEKSVNPFDLWNGCNFKLKMVKVDKFPNYDKSEFVQPSPIFEDPEDPRYETLWRNEYSLQALLNPSNFKTYDALKKRLYEVLGEPLPAGAPTASAAPQVERAAPKPVPQNSVSNVQSAEDAGVPEIEEEVEITTNVVEADDDEEINFFKNVANNM